MTDEHPAWTEADLLHHLSPESLQLTLRRASTLLTGWELVRGDVVGKTSEFFASNWNRDLEVTAHRAEYRTEVLDKHRALFVASTQWLRDQGALTPAQLGTLDALRQHRNEVAHELPRFLCDPGARLRVDLLLAARGCLASLSRFWGASTLAANPEFDHVDVDPDDVRSGTLLLYDLVLEAGGVLSQQ